MSEYLISQNYIAQQISLTPQKKKKVLKLGYTKRLFYTIYIYIYIDFLGKKKNTQIIISNIKVVLYHQRKN